MKSFESQPQGEAEPVKLETEELRIKDASEVVEEPPKGQDFESLLKNPVTNQIVEQKALEYLRSNDWSYFDREFTGELDAAGYLIKKDGTSGTKPSQNIGGGYAMKRVVEMVNSEIDAGNLELWNSIDNPEVVVAETEEVKEKFEDLSAAQHGVSDLEQALPLIQENNPELADKVSEMKESLEAKIEKSEQELEIARLKAEISEFNKIVQKSETMERFGAKHGFSKDDTYAFVERMVLKNEKRIHELEGNEKLLKMEAKERNRIAEINRLKAEIVEINKIVQNSETLEKFGAENGFSRPDTYAYVEKVILNNENRIRELEGSTALKEKPSQAEEEGETSAEASESGTQPEERSETAAEVSPAEEVPVAPAEEVPGAPITPVESTERNEQAEPAGERILTREERFNRPLSQMEQDHLLRSFEAEKPKKSWRGWWKERFKGGSTVGFWEFHQAERFRSNKKETAKEIAEAAEKIRKTEKLSLEDALEEAQIMAMMASERSIDKPGSADYERFSQAISGEKIKENNKRIDLMVAAASASLTERLAKYRDEFGEVVVSDEKIMANFESDLRTSLLTLQNGQKEVDAKEYNKLITEKLDPNYWRRYVYGALEATLLLWGLKVGLANLASSKWWLGKKAVDVGSEAVMGHDMNLPIEGGASNTGEMPMNNTIWQTAKEWLQEQGIANPTNQEVMSVSKEVATESNIGVKEWGIDGKPLDTNMQQGHLLKFGGASKVLMAIKIARGISAVI